MKLYDNTNQYNSLFHLSLRWAKADENNFTYDDFIQSFNVAINKITAVVQRHDMGWKWRDRNATGELLDTSNTLASGKSKYELSAPWLKLARVRILLDDGSTWKTLKYQDRHALSDYELSMSSVEYWYVLGGYLYLAGQPNYSQANGIEVQYQNGPVHFTPSDKDVEVGFSPLFEELGALMPALDYLEINGPAEQAQNVEKKVGVAPRRGVEGQGLLNDLAVSYQDRNDTMNTITLQKSNRAASLLDTTSGDYPLTS